jgi:recombination DNA repair RAD52 pathway protein
VDIKNIPVVKYYKVKAQLQRALLECKVMLRSVANIEVPNAEAFVATAEKKDRCPSNLGSVCNFKTDSVIENNTVDGLKSTYFELLSSTDSEKKEAAKSYFYHKQKMEEFEKQISAGFPEFLKEFRNDLDIFEDEIGKTSATMLDKIITQIEKDLAED